MAVIRRASRLALLPTRLCEHALPFSISSTLRVQSRALSSSPETWIAQAAPPGIDAWNTKQGSPKAALTREGALLQRNLSKGTADPVALLRSRLESGTVDTETARLCLEATKSRLNRVPRRLRRRAVRDSGAGSLTLTWLWSQDNRWTEAICKDTRFLELLCYFGVSEGLEDLLISWMTQPLAGAYITSSDDALEHRWRGPLFRHLVGAHLNLDHRGSADDGLKLFFRILESVQQARQRDRYSSLAQISSWPAIVELQKALSTGWFPQTDSELFKKFIELSQLDVRVHEIAVAQLRLCHPSRPNVEPAIAYIRQHVEPLSRASFQAIFPSGSVKSSSIYFFFRRAERILRETNRHQDADYVDRLLKNFLGEQEHQVLQEKFRTEEEVMLRMRVSWTRPPATQPSQRSGKPALRWHAT